MITIEKLVFKRRKPLLPSKSPDAFRVRIDESGYEIVMEIAEESGESIKSIVSKMIQYAYQHVTFESEDN